MLIAREKHQLKIAKKVMAKFRGYEDSYVRLIVGMTVEEAKRIIKKLGKKGGG